MNFSIAKYHCKPRFIFVKFHLTFVVVFRSAFFKGQVEQVTFDRRLWKPRTMNVSIGVGREGITIFRESKTVECHLLLSIKESLIKCLF